MNKVFCFKNFNAVTFSFYVLHMWNQKYYDAIYYCYISTNKYKSIYFLNKLKTLPYMYGVNGHQLPVVYFKVVTIQESVNI